MDALRLGEITYNAQQGRILPLDSFEILELIEAAAKVDELQAGQGFVYDDIHSETDEITSSLKDLKEQTAILKSLVEENKDDFPECFLLAFTENIEAFETVYKEINSAKDEIDTLADNAQGDIYNLSF